MLRIISATFSIHWIISAQFCCDFILFSHRNWKFNWKKRRWHCILCTVHIYTLQMPIHFNCMGIVLGKIGLDDRAPFWFGKFSAAFNCYRKFRCPFSTVWNSFESVLFVTLALAVHADACRSIYIHLVYRARCRHNHWQSHGTAARSLKWFGRILWLCGYVFTHIKMLHTVANASYGPTI